MRRRAAIAIAGVVAAALALASPPALSAPACTVTWDGGAGTTAWDAPANWSGDALPGPADHVCIPAGSVAVHSSGTTAIASVQGGGTVRLQGGRFGPGADTDAALTRLELEGGTLEGAGRLTVTGQLVWSGTFMEGAGTLVAAPSAAVTIDTGGNVVGLSDTRALLLHGTTTWASGSVSLGPGTPLLENTGTFLAQAENGTVGSNGSGHFHNTGALRKSTGTGITRVRAPIDNDGTADAQTGTLELAAGAPGFVSTGTFGASGATARLRIGGALFGRFVLGGGARLTGRVELGLTTIEVAGPVTLEGTGNELSVADIVGAGTLSVTGSLRWTGGRMAGHGVTVIGPTGSLDVDTFSFGVSMFESRTLRVEGTAVWTAGQLVLRDAARIENLGLLDARSQTGSITAFGAREPELYNHGILTKTQGTGTTSINLAVVNDGAVEPRTGTLAIDEGFGRAYAQTVDGRHRVEVGGLTPGTGFGALALGGTARLAGTLQIVTAAGFAPQVGNTVKVIGYGTRNGEFANVTGTAIPGGLRWQVRYDPDGVRLVATAAPVSAKRPALASPANRPPTARPERYRVRPGDRLRIGARRGVLANDRDPDGEPLRVVVAGRSRRARGLHLERRTGALSWRTPRAFRGTAWLRYRVVDPAGARSRPVRLHVSAR